MSELDEARALVARLEKQEELAAAIRAAGEAYEADPTQENLAAHNAACEDMVAFRAEQRVEGSGPVVGGDAFVVPSDEGE